MSTNTGVAPTSITASAVDIQVKLGTMTCSIHEKILMSDNRQAFTVAQANGIITEIQKKISQENGFPGQSKTRH